MPIVPLLQFPLLQVDDQSLPLIIYVLVLLFVFGQCARCLKYDQGKHSLRILTEVDKTDLKSNKPTTPLMTNMKAPDADIENA